MKVLSVTFWDIRGLGFNIWILGGGDTIQPITISWRFNKLMKDALSEINKHICWTPENVHSSWTSCHLLGPG